MWTMEVVSLCGCLATVTARSAHKPMWTANALRKIPLLRSAFSRSDAGLHCQQRGVLPWLLMPCGQQVQQPYGSPDIWLEHTNRAPMPELCLSMGSPSMPTQAEERVVGLETSDASCHVAIIPSGASLRNPYVQENLPLPIVVTAVLVSYNLRTNPAWQYLGITLRPVQVMILTRLDFSLAVNKRLRKVQKRHPSRINQTISPKT